LRILSDPRRLRRATAALLAVTLQGSLAGAEEPVHCAPIAGAAPELAAVSAAARLGFVRDVMRDQAGRARTWTWVWGIGGLALAAGNFGLAALADTPDHRVDPLVGGVTSLFIPAALLVKPVAVIANHAALEDYLALTASTSGEGDACATLARAEELLVASAEDEALGVGVLAQAIAILGNGAIALFLGLGYGHWAGALLNGGGGLVITEVQIFTQPTGAVRALESYRRGAVQVAPQPPRVAWSVMPLVPIVAPRVAASEATGSTSLPQARGLALGASF
jgi:hypothetical protein